VAWVTELAGPVTSSAEVKTRPWASVWKLETTNGVVFAKQNCVGQRHETSLLRTLSQACPERVVEVVGLDQDRGLVATADAGPVVGPENRDLDIWCTIVQAAATLQRALVSHAAQLVESGVAAIDFQMADVYVSQRQSELHSLPPSDPRHLTALALAEVERASEPIAEAMKVLSDLDLPLSLQHNDLHGNNVCVNSGTFRFFDFADSVVGEPLGVLLIPLRILTMEWGLAPDSPEVAHVVNAYLEVWGDLASMRELRAALPHALRLAALPRVESWIRCANAMDAEALAERAFVLPGWLQELAKAPPFQIS
jgi:hypothetical protein